MYDKIVCVRHGCQIKSEFYTLVAKPHTLLRDMLWPDEPYIRFMRFLTSSFTIVQRISL